MSDMMDFAASEYGWSVETILGMRYLQLVRMLEKARRRRFEEFMLYISLIQQGVLRGIGSALGSRLPALPTWGEKEQKKTQFKEEKWW